MFHSSFIILTRHKKSLSTEIEKKPVIWMWHFCAVFFILIEQEICKQNHVMNILSD